MKNDDPKEKSGRSLWAKLRSGTGVDRGEGGKEAGPSAATPPPAPTAGAGAKPARQAPQPKERWATSDLGAFVEKLESLGGHMHPNAAATHDMFELVHETKVDTTLDPFSDEYVAQQIALYEEISGRSLDQESGEMTHIDPGPRVDANNPYGTKNVGFIAQHARAVLTTLMIANLPNGARILDLGAGWGLSSEAAAFTGAKVTAVDINPNFTELVNRRAARLKNGIKAVRSNFDAFDTSDRFDLILFYECLHHAVKPWETIANAARFLAPGGRIAFAGEPVNEVWWPHWGLRIGGRETYVIHKHGWFESGWSEKFIGDCFRRAGLEFVAVRRAGLRGGVVGIGTRPGEAADRPIIVPPGAVRVPTA
ncbi:MAG: class I SAM-dependent methyltransferase [Alterinioella nitratireducens]|uniref:class I SAM-dependent methyltransferase n=1 Tax=Alterinioella nitratireducens TaxID=2735915 RepID=UPI004058112B